MSPNFRRYLPFMIGALALLILISALAKHSSTTPTTASDQSTATVQTLDRVNRAERLFRTAHGTYTDHVADLLVESHALGGDLAEGVVIQLDVGTGGQSFYTLVQSPVLSEVAAWSSGKLLTQNCTVLKSGSGVACPATSTAKT
jgi:hypothetical protein